jgi:hypothetical protein
VTNAIGVVVLMLVAALSHGRPANAQELRGFAGAGVASDLNSRYPAAGGGVLLDLPGSWVTAGGEADLFTSGGYVAGRGAAFGQGNVIRRGTVRPFGLAGYGWGESGGPMIGAGVDVRFPGRRIGLRASVEDYLVQVHGFDCGSLGYTQSYCDANLKVGRAYTGHQVSMRFGILF